jgi:hypothetical protein
LEMSHAGAECPSQHTGQGAFYISGSGYGTSRLLAIAPKGYGIDGGGGNV